MFNASRVVLSMTLLLLCSCVSEGGTKKSTLEWVTHTYNDCDVQTKQSLPLCFDLPENYTIQQYQPFGNFGVAKEDNDRLESLMKQHGALLLNCGRQSIFQFTMYSAPDGFHSFVLNKVESMQRNGGNLKLNSKMIGKKHMVAIDATSKDLIRRRIVYIADQEISNVLTIACYDPERGQAFSDKDWNRFVDSITLIFDSFALVPLG